MCQVEDAVRWGTVRGLMWDNGCGVGHRSGAGSQRGQSLIRLCESGRSNILDTQHSSTMDGQTKGKEKKITFNSATVSQVATY